MSLNVGIFCGSKLGLQNNFFNQTKTLAKFIHKNNFNIVMGGEDSGLMRNLAKEASNLGVRIFGIIISKLDESFRENYFISDVIVTENTEKRKKQFLFRSDFFIVLPGGLGTLNELIDLIIKKEYQEVNKKIFLVNENNFWNPFIELINYLIKQKLSNKNILKSNIEILPIKETMKKIEEELNDKN